MLGLILLLAVLAAALSLGLFLRKPSKPVDPKPDLEKFHHETTQALGKVESAFISQGDLIHELQRQIEKLGTDLQSAKTGTADTSTALATLKEKYEEYLKQASEVNGGLEKDLEQAKGAAATAEKDKAEAVRVKGELEMQIGKLQEDLTATKEQLGSFSIPDQTVQSIRDAANGAFDSLNDDVTVQPARDEVLSFLDLLHANDPARMSPLFSYPAYDPSRFRVDRRDVAHRARRIVDDSRAAAWRLAQRSGYAPIDPVNGDEWDGDRHRQRFEIETTDESKLRKVEKVHALGYAHLGKTVVPADVNRYVRALAPAEAETSAPPAPVVEATPEPVAPPQVPAPPVEVPAPPAPVDRGHAFEIDPTRTNSGPVEGRR